MAKNKNQHYVPAFYLYNFTNNAQRAASKNKPKRETNIYHYDCRKGSVVERPIRKVAIESYLYSYIDENANYNHSLDQEIQRVENNASTAIKQLSAIVKDIIKKKSMAVPIDDSLINAIMDLLFWQIKRHPDIIREIELECERWYLDKGYSSENAKAVALDSIRRLGKGGKCDIITELEKKNKVIVFTVKPEAHFITSDKPFVRLNKTGKNGILVNGTEMYYPITSNMLLFMCGNGHRKDLIPERSRPFLRQLNTYMAKSAKNYLFGKSNRYLERLLRNLRHDKNNTSLKLK